MPARAYPIRCDETRVAGRDGLTPEQGLQEECTAEAKEAWATVYGLSAQTMKDAAAS